MDDNSWFCNIDFELDVPKKIVLNTDGIPDTITVIPPVFPDIPIHVWGEADQIRSAILTCLGRLPENQTMDGMPVRIWIGRPALEDVIKVKGEILRVMAYYDWEKAGRPHGRDQEFWFAAEKRFDDAYMQWM